ncbi:helix-turn-helix domain-containing protein [Nocardia sp. NPDC046473]|uniref:winged helix-turn-helix transcriptional regulator n=1 Tax=Nocardia sp. NPDC046473 TaxID=3155733 RepID=UPI0033ECF4A2
MSSAAGTMFMSDCPARTAIEIVANKWSVVTLYALKDGPRRHSELVALSGGISRKVLTQTLRRLQSNGLIERQRYAEAPPRVEYSLTPLGRTLQEPIAMLTEWAQTHGETLVDFQESIAANQTH